MNEIEEVMDMVLLKLSNAIEIHNVSGSEPHDAIVFAIDDTRNWIKKGGLKHG